MSIFGMVSLMKHLLSLSFFLYLITFGCVGTTFASPKVGMHILDTTEIDSVSQVITGTDPVFVTIPIRLDQLNHSKWREFFTQAKKKNIVPIVRLATTYNSELEAWEIPSRADIV